MTEKNILKYIELYDELQDTCNKIASVFCEVDDTFLYTSDWEVTPSYMKSTGKHAPGYVFCMSPTWSCVHIPFLYLSMSEDELREVVNKRPEEIKAMIINDFDNIEDFEDE